MSGFGSIEELTVEFWRVWEDDDVEGLLTRYEDVFTDDAVWSPPIAQVAGHDYVGRAGFAQYVGDFRQAFNSFEPNVESVEAIAGADGAEGELARATVRLGAELANGGRIDAKLLTVVRVRGGRIDYAWGGYDPEAAERKLAELSAAAGARDA